MNESTDKTDKIARTNRRTISHNEDTRVLRFLFLSMHCTKAVKLVLSFLSFAVTFFNCLKTGVQV